MSNLFEVKVPHKVNNKHIEGKSLEQSYQYNKAVVITGSDQGISREILNAKTAVTAKYLGDKLKKHDNYPTWKKIQVRVMEELDCSVARNRKCIPRSP